MNFGRCTGEPTWPARNLSVTREDVCKILESVGAVGKRSPSPQQPADEVRDGKPRIWPMLPESAQDLANGSRVFYSVQDDSSCKDEVAGFNLDEPGCWWEEHTDSDDYTEKLEVHRLRESHAALESLPEATFSEEEAACSCAVCKGVNSSRWGSAFSGYCATSTSMASASGRGLPSGAHATCAFINF
ncbi:hypothetical protein ACUV84_011275 [Puccinellia chinampoensis]